MATNTAPSPKALKRFQRGASSDALIEVEGGQPAAKRQETHDQLAAAPLLPPSPGETQSAYFARLAAHLHSISLFRRAHSFDQDGLYIYKRPVRSAAADKVALLSSAGSVFHHVVVYVKQGEQLSALEFGPGNQMDITDDMLAEAVPAPVLLRPAPPPEHQHLPMLHIGVPHHPLEAQRVQQALCFAEGTRYHALHNNCIAFADYLTRVLTGGAVRGAPLIFDALCGSVPLLESPLLPLLTVMTQLSWHDVCDGSRLTRAFLQRHPAGLPPLLPGAEALALLEEPAGCGEAATEPAVPMPRVLPGTILSALIGLLPPGAPAAAAAGSARVPGPAQMLAPMPAQPTASSSASDDTESDVELAASTSVGASLSSGSSLASSNSNKAPLGMRGMVLPPSRATKARSVAALDEASIF